MTKLLKNKLVAMFAMMIMISGTAMLAGGTGTEFDGVAATLTDWAEGGLGRVFAILFFMIGMAVGLARQSLFAAVTGLGAALVVSLGPTVINGIVTAGVPIV